MSKAPNEVISRVCVVLNRASDLQLGADLTPLAQEVFRTVGASVLYEALQAVDRSMTDVRDLYSADHAIDTIREWAAVRGLELPD